MVAIPSGRPIPTPSAVGKLAECFWVRTGAEASVDVLAGEAVVTGAAVITVMLEVVTRADDEGVRGGNPSILPLG